MNAVNRMKEEALARKIMDGSEQLNALADSPACTSAERRRALGLLNWARCRNQSAVARVTGRARSTKQRTLKALDQFNIDGLRNRRTNAQGQAADLADTVWHRLVELAAHTPEVYGWQLPTWTRELFCAELTEKFGIVYSRSHIGRLLTAAGCRRVRPKPTVRLAPANKAKLLAELATTLAAVPPDEPLFFKDECDIALNPKSGPEWTPAVT